MQFWRDVSYAVRTLRKAPLFTAVVAGTLAVAIAANAIIFGALEAVFLKPLPYASADRLVIVGVTDPKMGNQFLNGVIPPTAGLADIMRKSSLVEAAGASQSGFSTQVRVDGRVAMLNQGLATRSYFQTLGVTPYIGRFFGTRGGQTEAVISYAYWLKHYNRDPGVIGKQTTIDDKTYTIAGVAPRGMVDPDFGKISLTDIWVLTTVRTTQAPVIIRMRPGVAIGALRAELNRVWSTSSGQSWRPMLPKWTLLEALPVRDAIVQTSGGIWIFFAAAAAVLLIACVNIANLILVRSASRRNEFAVRAALGASRRRIAAQSITETLVLCAFGCFLGLVIAIAALHPVIALIPGNFPRLSDASLDLNVVLYVCALGIGVALLAGVLPAFTAGNKPSATRGSSRRGTALVAIEVAAAFALLVCSALLLRSFLTMTAQPLDFNPRHAYAASFGPKSFDPRVTARPILAANITQRIAALPGVAGAALAFRAPFVGLGLLISEFWLPGEPRPKLSGGPDPARVAVINWISPDFLPLMEIPVLRGRNLTQADVTGAKVAVVNQAFARRFLKGKSPIGQLVDGFNYSSSIKIVGMVPDARDSLTQDPQAQIYVPFTKKSPPFFQIAFRTTSDDPHLAAEITALSRFYPQYSIPIFASVESAIYDSAANARAAFFLLAALTMIALILALAGIYGVVAFSVESRYHEIGIRLAIGATNLAMLRKLINAALLQCSLGLALGIIATAFAVRGIESQLYKTQPFDSPSFIGAIVLLLACTVIAAAIPAWRALAIDPARTLRYE